MPAGAEELRVEWEQGRIENVCSSRPGDVAQGEAQVEEGP